MNDCTHIDSSVINSRQHADGTIRRRRKCDACGHRWNTREIAEELLTQLVDALNAANAEQEVDA